MSVERSARATHCRTRMAKVVWAPGISTVSGALTKINKKSPHAADQQMLLATHRTAPTTSNACNKLYLRGLKSVTRTTPVTADELAVRNRFATVAQQVNTRAHNMSTYPSDYAAFQAQKDQPGGKKTFKAYLWKVLGEVYDENQG